MKIIFLFLALSLNAQQKALVERIIDGDTVVLLIYGQTVTARLAAIDAPEKSQPFGPEAAQHLSDLLLGQTVLVEVLRKDRFGRTVVNLYIADLWVNESLLLHGLAHHMTRFDNTPRLISAQAFAKHNRNGLWIQPDPVLPQTYRSRR